MFSHSDKVTPSPPATARSRRSTPRIHTPNTVTPFSRWTPTIVRPAVGRPRTAGHVRPPLPTPPSTVSATQHGADALPLVTGAEPASSTSTTSGTPIQDPSEPPTARSSRTRPVSAPIRRPEDQAKVLHPQAATPSESAGPGPQRDEISEVDLQDLMPQDGEQIFWKRRFFSQGDLDGTGPTAFEVVLSGSERSQLARDYLTWYYCDFFEAEPAEELPLTGTDTTTVTKIVEWLNRFRPRTRVDAYPMLQVAIDVIRRLTRQELKVEYEHYDAFQHEIERLQSLADHRQTVIDAQREENQQLTNVVSSLKETIQYMNDTHESKIDAVKEQAEQRERELSSEMERMSTEKDSQIKQLHDDWIKTKEDLHHFKTQLARTATESKAFQQRMATLQKDLREIEARKELEKVLVTQGQKADKRKWIFQNLARTTLTAHFTSWRVLTVQRLKVGKQNAGDFSNIRKRVDSRFLRAHWLAWDDAVTQRFRYREMCRKALGRACGQLFQRWVGMVHELKWDAALQSARALFRRAMDRSLSSITKSWRAWARKEAHYHFIEMAILGKHQLLLLRIGFRVLQRIAVDNLLQQSGWTGATTDRKPPVNRRSSTRANLARQDTRTGLAGSSPRSPRSRQDSSPRSPKGSSPRSPRGLGGKRISRRDLLAAAERMRGGSSPIAAMKPPVDFAGVVTTLTQTTTSAEQETFLKHIQTKTKGL